jgi:hypothetical protein
MSSRLSQLVLNNKKAATVSRGGFLIAEGSSARLFDRDEVLSFAGLAVTYSSKP